MTDAQIYKSIRTEIGRAFRAPGVIVSPDAIAGIAYRVAVEVMQPIWEYTQTTDATPTTVKTIEIEDGSTALVEVHAIAVKTDGTESGTFRMLTHIRKTGGVLTWVTQEDSLVSTFVGASMTIGNDGSDNVKVEITGVAATDIDWICNTTYKILTASALP